MKIFRKLVWIIMAFMIVLLLFVAVFFEVDDMTLAEGAVYEFDSNWV